MTSAAAAVAEPPKFIVTGANGFIGAPLAHRCRALGDVLAVDRYWGPAPRAPEPRAELDLAQPVPDAPELRGATVIHTAGPVDGEDRQALWEGNVAATFHVLDWAVRHQAVHVVLFSSGEVYPFAAGHRHRESGPVEPWRFAGHTKLLAERLAASFHHLFRLPVTVVRPFFPYGPAQSGGLIAAVRAALAAGEPITPPAAGECRLNPVHLDDLLDAVLGLAKRGDGLRVVNVCGDEALPFAELVERLATATGRTPRLAPPPPRCGDLLGDNTLLKELLGWRPRRTLADLGPHCS